MYLLKTKFIQKLEKVIVIEKRCYSRIDRQMVGQTKVRTFAGPSSRELKINFVLTKINI